MATERRPIHIVSVAAVALLVIGVVLFLKNFQLPASQNPDSPSPELEPAVSHLEAPPSPVSLPALFQKEITGTDLTLGPVLATTDAYTRYYVTYRSGELKISGIFNLPRGDGPFPLLVLNHGHIDTAVYTNGRGLKREQDYLARRGYAVVHPDYRNHADSDDDPNAETNLRLGYTEDAIAAVFAVRAAKLPAVDATRVGMLGHSMGGGVTLNVLVTRPDLVQAAVLFAPVSSDARDSFERWMARQSPTGPEVLKRYGSPTTSPEFWDNISPMTFFDRVNTPIQIHHGTADADVPLEWSEQTLARLKAAGKTAELYVYEGEPHEFINAWPTVMARTVAFFDTLLKPKKSPRDWFSRE